MSEIPPATRERSPLFMIVISIILILSVMALYNAIKVYMESGSPDIASIMLGLIGIGIAIFSYMLIQMRGKPLKLGFETSKVFTVVRCTSCGFENAREFNKGDYILKDAEPCPKCNSRTIVSSIYREAEEKEE